MKWLILRGLVREQRHWGDFKKTFADDLRAVDPAAEVHAIDFPGFGTETHRASPFSIAEIVRDTRARWLNYGGREWSLLAISLGGMVALEWCKQYPEDFKKLVLVNSSVSSLSPFYQRLKPTNYKTIFSFFGDVAVREREENILKLTTNLTGDLLKTRAQWQADFALPVRRRDAAAQLIAAIRFQAPNKISIPTLVLTSLGDRLVDSRCSDALAKFYGARIAKHPTANHDLPTDAPHWIGEQVRDWVTKS
jgi:pimeloyl-ACP methyl ester carboxylesterase